MVKIPRTYPTNEAYLHKLKLLGHYSDPVVVDMLEQIIKYDDILLPVFCTKYIWDTGVTKPMVQCELVQYVADEELYESEEAILACEDILGSMGAVLSMLEVIKEGIKLRDMIDFKKYKDSGISEEIICSELASYMIRTGTKVRDTKFISSDKGVKLYYLNRLIETGDASDIVSFDLIDNVVTLSFPDIDGAYISYYLGHEEVGYNGFESYDDEDEWDRYSEYDW